VRAKRPCAEPGCPTLVAKGRCPAHAVVMERRHDPEQRKFYSSRKWQKQRAQVRREEPICRMCQERPTTRVDHIDGNWRNGARSNLRGLCTPCEASHTGRQHRAKRDDVSFRPPSDHAGSQGSFSSVRVWGV
jgi:5-methylcytosine-specific restriction enzyme A